MNNTMPKVAENAESFTYFGYAEYFGETSLYDGNSDPKFQGTVLEVVEFLRNIRRLESLASPSIKWRGSNGEWYQGEEAVFALDAEIASLLDGSHFSLNA